MWVVIKFHKNQLYNLKRDLKNKLGEDLKIYLPKLKLARSKSNKIYNSDSLLLGDYLLCYHSKFSLNGIINSLKYCKGIKYFLDGFLFSQEEIIKFIKNCKVNEDKNGYIKQSFFNFASKQNFEFISGPFNKMIFRIINENRNRLKILIKDIEVTVSKKKEYIFKPV